MSQKSQTHRDNVPVLGSESSFQTSRAKSALNIAVCSARNSPENSQIQRNQNTETRSLNSKNATRNFNFTFGAAKVPARKNYMKNSDKTIKPPEKPLKAIRPASAKPKTSLQREGTTTLLARTHTNVKCVKELISERPATTKLTSKRSLTFDNSSSPGGTVTPPYARIDVNAIDELAKRCEHLQTILMNKLELLYSREPGTVKKAYKFVAMIVGDEAKLLVKDSDAQRLPSHIPARSAEDLNTKISKFFAGCLIAFTDKLRAYQHDNRNIDCDQLFKELKRDEEVFCAILKDWVNEMCDEADTTLVNSATENQMPITQKDVRDYGTQADFDPAEVYDNMPDKDFVEMLNLRKELSGLQLQLFKKEENHLEEIGMLKDKFDVQVKELSNKLLTEQAASITKDEKINKLQSLNESLSQQLEETNSLLETLTNRNEVLNAKIQNDMDMSSELKTVREELQSMRQENNYLKEMQANFLKKLNQRSVRIDLLDKEIGQQKRKMEIQNKEIEDLKLEFEAKVKENRDYKQSLDARNELIDHLRKAVEIEERKRKEYEENFLNASKGEKPFPTGIKFNDKPTLPEPWKLNFNELYTLNNFSETIPNHVKAPISKLKKERKAADKSNNDKRSNSNTSSSDEMIAVNERHRPRKARNIVLKKRQ